MCIAIYHDQSCPLTEDEFVTSWTNNPDGGGFTYFDEAGDLVIKKSMHRNELMSAYYEAIDKYGDSSPFAIHFRIATHGLVNLDNCHPFRANANTVVMHNGIIPVIMNKGDKRSDTRVFVEEYMSRMPKGWLDDEYLFDLAQEYIGSSKIIIMTNDPKANSYLYIMNEKMGHWSEDGKTWYSNKSYCSSTTKKYNLTGWSQPSMDEPLVHALPQCPICDEHAVYDDMCYNCETCLKCESMEDMCRCYTRINGLTDEEFVKGQGGWSM